MLFFFLGGGGVFLGLRVSELLCVLSEDKLAILLGKKLRPTSCLMSLRTHTLYGYNPSSMKNLYVRNVCDFSQDETSTLSDFNFSFLLNVFIYCHALTRKNSFFHLLILTC